MKASSENAMLAKHKIVVIRKLERISGLKALLAAWSLPWCFDAVYCRELRRKIHAAEANLEAMR